MLSDLEKEVILLLQRDLKITPRPFLELAQRLGVAEEELLGAIQSLKDKGYIRRFGATLRHQLSGFGANALVAWIVPEEQLRATGEKLAGYRAVTHCYGRRSAPSWPYNLYTMIHGRTPEEIARMAAQMAQEIGISDYQILMSDVELKKTTMRYFREETRSED
ncbi:MAG: Lrp/AsnC family transcriptional regulator [Thermodesulfobacteriota bacterium]